MDVCIAYSKRVGRIIRRSYNLPMTHWYRMPTTPQHVPSVHIVCLAYAKRDSCRHRVANVVYIKRPLLDDATVSAVYTMFISSTVTPRRISQRIPEYWNLGSYAGVRRVRYGYVVHTLRVHWGTLAYVVVRQVNPKVLSMHKTFWRMSAYYSYVMHTMPIRCRYVMWSLTYVSHTFLGRMILCIGS